ncbi:hypothetical protein BDV23DRAFT_160557 [Aspergillus alliaceus]|uniref:Transcription factor domain-containing protein n=1 Tax=Petromyces alliaceus TaxID=209559 RepID=A0A5N7C1N8_PETAA|nr:hypothetical protein BDV23DRAFT_160557 [Aspergillus alliaceus]
MLHPMSEATLTVRRSYAELYAHAALNSIENWTDLPELPTPAMDLTGGSPRWSSLHPSAPLKLESVVALVLLGVYEYCQRGNFSKMRSRANKALATAVDLPPYIANLEGSRCSDAQSRAW